MNLIVSTIFMVLLVGFSSQLPLNDNQGESSTPSTDWMYRVNPEEIEGDIEGDILLTDLQKTSKSGMTALGLRWPNARIPYTINAAHYSSYHQTLIRTAMDEIQKYTCIRFVPRAPSDYDYVAIQNGTGCSSFVGRAGGAQRLSLLNANAATCMTKGIIMHELIHAIGYRHMHSSSERDNYVTINYGNIQPGTEHNFVKYTASQVSNYGTIYDVESIMHYPTWAFTSNGRDTITPRDSRYASIMGQRVRLTQGDIDRIKNMYKC